MPRAVLLSRREAASNCPTTNPNQARCPHRGRLAAVARAWHRGVLEKAPVVCPFLLRPDNVVTSGESLDTMALPCGRRVARGASSRVGQRTHTIHPPGDAGGMSAKERRSSASVRCCPLCILPPPRCQRRRPPVCQTFSAAAAEAARRRGDGRAAARVRRPPLLHEEQAENRKLAAAPTTLR